MKSLMVPSMILSVVVAAGAQNAAPPTSTPAPQARPARVRAKLSGFELTTGGKHNTSNQIGGASRGIKVKLFAPEKGLAYSLHPTFQWSGSPDTKYKLEIEDLSDQTSFEVTIAGTSFTYPEAATPLKPGNTYSWKVEPEIDLTGGVSDPAEFSIAGGAQRQMIEAALAAITQTGEAADRARAQVYFDKRVWYDAAEAYSILISAHPADPELRRMRGTLYDQVPATEKLADADFAAAK